MGMVWARVPGTQTAQRRTRPPKSDIMSDLPSKGLTLRGERTNELSAKFTAGGGYDYGDLDPGIVADAKPAVASSPAQQRKDQLAADAARLDQLAKELKIEMDKSTKDTLSMTVLKKAAEIEKLARKVREEIAQSLSN